jgi:formamidopyrimidine-DNA glycosylase
VDARRLGRIRLCASPLTEPPISELGFDPILSMPSLEAFTPLVLKRSCPVKALLLDQSFSAGIGNWIAGKFLQSQISSPFSLHTDLILDEVLYHARIHPEQRCNTLTEEQLIALHHRIEWVCRTAVDVNADHSKFPQDWLFRYRWVGAFVLSDGF